MTSHRRRQPELIRQDTLDIKVDLGVITITGKCGLQYGMTVADFAQLISRVKRAARQPSINQITERMLQL